MDNGTTKILFDQAVENAEKEFKGKKMEFGHVASGGKVFMGITVEGQEVFSFMGTMDEIRNAFIKRFLN